MSGLSDKDKKAHDKHLEKGSKKADDDKSAYKQSPADKKAKTKPSKHKVNVNLFILVVTLFLQGH